MNTQIEDYSCFLKRLIFKTRVIRGKLFFVLLFFQFFFIQTEIYAIHKTHDESFDKFSIQTLISGIVTDNNGSPLPGASVLVKGTSIGASTDFDGNYTIQANANDILIFSYIGFVPQEVPVNAKSTINVTLKENASELDEIIVVGYGTRAKKDLTGAVSSLSADELSPQINASPEFAIQGRLPGVFISNPGSNPNSRPDVRIRGVSTLGFNDPLYVIDGVPVIEGGAASTDPGIQDDRGSVNVLNLINPSDIKSVTVLKDASATAIYGVRASNGVILIETKRGRKGRTNISFSKQFGFQYLPDQYDVLNTQEYTEISNRAWANNPNISRDTDPFGVLYNPDSNEFLGNSPTYDWVDDALRNTSIRQDYNLSVSGGSEKSNFALGMGYAKQEDLFFDTQFERYSFSINSDHKVTDWLEVGESYRIAITNTPDEQVFNGNLLRQYTFAPPWQPIRDAANGVNGFATTGREVNGTFSGNGYGAGTVTNFRGYGTLWEQRSLLIRNLGSIYAELKPLPGLRIRGTLSIDYYTNRRDQFKLADADLFRSTEGVPDEDGAQFSRRLTTNYNLTTEFLIGYRKNFGKHNFDLTLNAMDQKVEWDVSLIEGRNTNLINFNDRFIDESLITDNRPGFLNRTRSGLLGYLGRLSYNFDSKYYIDGTIRRDGSSKFAEDYKWGTFPAVGVAWRLSSESFMENLNWLNDLKLRAGWGQTGNQETRDFAYLSLVNQNPSYPTSGGSNPGAFSGDFPIVDTTWETVTSTNIGVDAQFLDNSFNLTFEYYFRETEDILQAIDTPLVLGINSDPVVNLATVENKGIEINLGYNKQFGKLGFSANFNFTTVDNVVTKMYNDRFQGPNTARIEVGYPIGYLFGYQTDGILQSQEEVNEYISQFNDPSVFAEVAPGDLRFRDLFGPPDPNSNEEGFVYRSNGADGELNTLDQTYLGKTIPGYYYGINLNLDYKGFDLAVFFRGVGDVQKYNEEKRLGEGFTTVGRNYFNSLFDSWTPENRNTSIPRLIVGDPAGNTRFSDRWIEDADFLRLQNVQLGYTFGPDLLDQIKATNLRIYTNLTNVFVITPYSGIDPEDDTTPFTFSMGLNVGF
ncbi:TonB-dependent receptor [Aquimarina sp. U1-2]|uniref:SusC/RagA family TonB-linked outer membrane protein n=1 Tax=Aquimarina sp. U1-2 TaxID=2823141 RepID=UPI001AEC78A5|nr:TonB-dependent receptor [Aquimarina sp. U1-2]MBP2832880.1 TonB-dependent receptor [Aquimarina sp. U1-2]